jgi:hypothetical protein
MAGSGPAGRVVDRRAVGHREGQVWDIGLNATKSISRIHAPVSFHPNSSGNGAVGSVSHSD